MRNRQVLTIVGGVSLLLHVVVLVYIVWFTPGHLLPIDDWVSSLPVARAAVEGTNPLPAIVKPVNFVHMHIPTHTTTYVLAQLTGWNPLAGALWNYVLGACNLVLALVLFARLDRALLPYLVLPFTALLLSVQQEANWIASLHNSRHYLPLFTMCALLAVTGQRRGWPNLMLAALATVAASFTLLDGMVVWVVVLAALPLLGYRKPFHYLFWVGLTLVMTVVYLNLPGIDPGNGALLDENESLVNFVQIGEYVLYLLIFISGVFSAGPDNANFLVLLMMAVFGLAMWGWNAVYLLRSTDERETVVVSGLLLLFVLGAGALNAIGRVNTFGVRWGAATHYIAAGVLFWVGLSVLIALVVRHLYKTEGASRHRGLVLANGLLVVMAVVFYVRAAAMTFQVTAADQERVAAIGACIEAVSDGANLPGCEVNGGVAERELILELAALELVGFRPIAD